jgi:hypothetical protein
LAELENEIFLVGHFDFFFQNIFFLLHSHENKSKFIREQGFFEILMITLVSSPKQHLPKDMQHSVPFNPPEYNVVKTLYCNFNLGTLPI